MPNPYEIKSVLLAEDDHDDLLIFKLALHELSPKIDIRHAENGEKLFTLLKEFIPDIIFLDIHMPCKDGLSCVEELRQNAEYNSIPIIMYTASVYEANINASYSSGANFYLLKAFAVSSLVENLKKIFSVEWKVYQYFPTREQFVLRN